MYRHTMWDAVRWCHIQHYSRSLPCFTSHPILDVRSVGRWITIEARDRRSGASQLLSTFFSHVYHIILGTHQHTHPHTRTKIHTIHAHRATHEEHCVVHINTHTHTHTHTPIYTIYANLFHAAQSTLLEAIRTLRHTSISERVSVERVSVERVFVEACLLAPITPSRPSPPPVHQHHSLYTFAHSFTYCYHML